VKLAATGRTSVELPVVSGPSRSARWAGLCSSCVEADQRPVEARAPQHAILVDIERARHRRRCKVARRLRVASHVLPTSFGLALCGASTEGEYPARARCPPDKESAAADVLAGPGNIAPDSPPTGQVANWNHSEISRVTPARADTVPTRNGQWPAEPELSLNKPLHFLRVFGAGDRDRTDDIQLGKLTFYH
jgi:hypothetical protein